MKNDNLILASLWNKLHFHFFFFMAYTVLLLLLLLFFYVCIYGNEKCIYNKHNKCNESTHRIINNPKKIHRYESERAIHESWLLYWFLFSRCFVLMFFIFIIFILELFVQCILVVCSTSMDVACNIFVLGNFIIKKKCVFFFSFLCLFLAFLYYCFSTSRSIRDWKETADINETHEIDFSVWDIEKVMDEEGETHFHE